METTTIKENVIYKTGEMGIQTSTYYDAEGIERCQYSGSLRGLEKDLTVPEYLAENPDCTLIEWPEALKLIHDLQEQAYICPWIEIDEDTYDEALNCLPPEKWMTVDGVNIFRMCEYTTSNITAHYARVNDRHFTASRRTSTKYEELAQQVKALLK